MNFLELIQTCQRLTKEPVVSSLSDADPDQSTWTLTEWKSRVNTINKKVCADTKCIKANTSVDLAASTWEYAMPATALVNGLIQVQFYNGSKYTKLKPVTISWLDQNIVDWRTTYGDPTRVFYSKTGYFGVQPGPDADYTSGLYVDYIKIPSDMTAATDYPFDGLAGFYGFHDVIVDGVVAMCKREDGDVIANMFENRYREGAEKIRVLADYAENDEISMQVKFTNG